MVMLGVLLLLLVLSLGWFIQLRSMALAASDSRFSKGFSKLPDRPCWMRAAPGTCVELPLGLFPPGITVVEAICALAARFEYGSQWNYESTRIWRGLDLCRCARNYKERFSPCLFQPMH